MLSIRLRRTGSTKRPYYRVVVADSRDVARRAFRRGARALRPAPRPRGGEDRRGAGEALDRRRAPGPPTPSAACSSGARRRPSAVKQLVSHLARGLVREPGRVRVHEHEEDGRPRDRALGRPRRSRPRDRPRGAHRERPAHAPRRAGPRGGAARARSRSSTDGAPSRTSSSSAGWSSRRAATGRWPCCPSPTGPTAFPRCAGRSWPAPGGEARELRVLGCWPHKGRFVLEIEGV